MMRKVMLLLICLAPLGALEMTLEEAIDRALTCNRSLLDSQTALQNASLGVASAESEFDIKLHPIGKTGYGGGQLNGTGYKYGGGIDFSKKMFTGTKIQIKPQTYSTDGQWCTDVNANLTQPILRGFGREVTMSKVFASQYSYRTAYRNLLMTQVKVILQTVQTVYEVIKQQEVLRTASESLDRLRHWHEAASVKEKLGLADASDVLRVEVEMKNAEEEWVKATEKEQEALDNLKLLLALPLDTPLVVRAPLEVHDVEVAPEEAVQVAMQRRLEVWQAIDRYKESVRLSRVAKNQTLPDINLVVNYVNSGCDESFTSSFVKCCTGTTWGVGLTTTGFSDYTQNCLAYQQSKLATITACRDIDQKRDQVGTEVKKQVQALIKAQKTIEIRKEQIQKAEENRDLAQVKFNHGLINNFDLIQPEKTIRKAEVELIASIVDYILSEYRLNAAMGLMWDDACIQ